MQPPQVCGVCVCVCSLVRNSRLSCLMLFHTLKRVSVKVSPLLQLPVADLPEMRS